MNYKFEPVKMKKKYQKVKLKSAYLVFFRGSIAVNYIVSQTNPSKLHPPLCFPNRSFYFYKG